MFDGDQQQIVGVSKPTTQGVVMKALLENAAYKFDPNKSLPQICLVGHRGGSQTRYMRIDAKLRSLMLSSGALKNENRLNVREIEECQEVDICPLCKDEDDGCAYGNQEHLIVFCPRFEEDRCRMYDQVEGIMRRAGRKFVGGRWNIQYPGKVEFQVCDAYASKYPILYGMMWLLPMLTLFGKRIASNVANTWLLSHKTVVDKRIYTQLVQNWGGKQSECEEIMDEIKAAVVQGVMHIHFKATKALKNFYSEVKKNFKEKSSKSDSKGSKGSCAVSKNKVQHVLGQSLSPGNQFKLRCSATWCMQICERTALQPNLVPEDNSSCKRCSKFKRAEQVINHFCKLVAADESRCKKLFDAIIVSSKGLHQCLDNLPDGFSMNKEVKEIVLSVLAHVLQSTRSDFKAEDFICACFRRESRHHASVFHCTRCDSLRSKVYCEVQPKQCAGIQCGNRSSSMSMMDCRGCGGSFHRHKICVGSVSDILQHDFICSWCTFRAKLVHISKLTCGEALIISVDTPVIKTDSFAEFDEVLQRRKGELKEGELRSMILQHKDQHWSKVIGSIRDVWSSIPKNESVVHDLSFPEGIFAAVGYGRGWCALLESDFRSLDYDEMVTDKVFDQALGLICSGVAIFPSKYSAAYLSCMGACHWLEGQASILEDTLGH